MSGDAPPLLPCGARLATPLLRVKLAPLTSRGQACTPSLWSPPQVLRSLWRGLGSSDHPGFESPCCRVLACDLEWGPPGSLNVLISEAIQTLLMEG